MKTLLLITLWCCLFAGADGPKPSSDQDEVICVPLNGDLELLPDTETITRITWKLNGTNVVDWDNVNGPKVNYTTFKREGTVLNTTTGKLNISHMTVQDSGNFSVEINGNRQTKNYTVEVNNNCRNVVHKEGVRKGATVQTDQDKVICIPLNGVLELLPMITDILWKLNGSKAAEWYIVLSPEVDYVRKEFKERKGTVLNTTTGKFTISRMQEQDSGTYSVEINCKVQIKTYKVEVKNNCKNDVHEEGGGDPAPREGGATVQTAPTPHGDMCPPETDNTWSHILAAGFGLLVGVIIGLGFGVRFSAYSRPMGSDTQQRSLQFATHCQDAPAAQVPSPRLVRQRSLTEKASLAQTTGATATSEEVTPLKQQ